MYEPIITEEGKDLSPKGFMSRVHAYSNAGTQIVNNGTTVTVAFAAEDFDTLDEYDIAIWRFTPKYSGYYLIAATIQWSNNANTGQARLRLRTGVTDLKYVRDWLESGKFITQDFCAVRFLTAGVEIHFSVSADVGIGQQRDIVGISGGISHTYLSIHRLS
jgi:hypothetical protein